MAHDEGIRLKRRFAWRVALDVVTSLVMIGAAIVLVSGYLSRSIRPPLRIPPDPIAIDGTASKGSPAAPVVMIAFADFQCPFCRRFARDVLPELEREYIAPGQVQFVSRHFPLPNHPFAARAAHAAECAGLQGQFWPMHDRFFAPDAQLDDVGLRAAARSLNLDDSAFAECLKQESLISAASHYVEQARSLGLVSTPSFLVGSRLQDGRVQVSSVFSGMRPIDEFRRELDRARYGQSGGWLTWIGGLARFGT